MKRSLLPVPLPATRVRLHLKPGQKGTKQLLAQYGDRLVCVRYRYDPERKKRFKTAEIIVGEREWEPLAPSAKDRVVGLRVAYGEADVRQRVKGAGGRWNADRRVWELRYDQAVTAGLADRITDDPASTGRCREDPAEYLAVDAEPASLWRCQHMLLDANIYRQMPAPQPNYSWTDRNYARGLRC